MPRWVRFVGNAGNDALLGGAGTDTMSGGAGTDTLTGGLGADILNGGANQDHFVYLTASEGGDSILSFIAAEDKFTFSAAGFGGGLTAGQHLVAGTTFIANDTPTATTAAGTFLYDVNDHNLLWDDDGTGAHAAVQIAHFDTAVPLTVDHFDIVA